MVMSWIIFGQEIGLCFERPFDEIAVLPHTALVGFGTSEIVVWLRTTLAPPPPTPSPSSPFHLIRPTLPRPQIIASFSQCFLNCPNSNKAISCSIKVKYSIAL